MHDDDCAIQELKRQHSIISGEMSGMRTNFFAGAEVINALEHLSRFPPLFI